MSIQTVEISDSRTGEPISAQVFNNGVYTWEIKNPLYFKITKHFSRPFSTNHDVIDIQLRLNYNIRKILKINKYWVTFRIFTSLRPPTLIFLNIIKRRINMYLDNICIITINNVLRALMEILWHQLPGTLDVELIECKMSMKDEYYN